MKTISWIRLRASVMTAFISLILMPGITVPQQVIRSVPINLVEPVQGELPEEEITRMEIQTPTPLRQVKVPGRYKTTAIAGGVMVAGGVVLAGIGFAGYKKDMDKDFWGNWGGMITGKVNGNLIMGILGLVVAATGTALIPVGLTGISKYRKRHQPLGFDFRCNRGTNEVVLICRF